MERLLTGVFFTTFCLLIITAADGQVGDTTHPRATDTTGPVSVNPELIALATSKTPKEYTLAGIKITGSNISMSRCWSPFPGLR
jgi:hypothetical protein